MHLNRTWRGAEKEQGETKEYKEGRRAKERGGAMLKHPSPSPIISGLKVWDSFVRRKINVHIYINVFINAFTKEHKFGERRF